MRKHSIINIELKSSNVNIFLEKIGKYSPQIEAETALSPISSFFLANAPFFAEKVF